MDPNSLYWLFSTVAQTLAALIALVGITAVYRMEQLSRSITRTLDAQAKLINSILDEEAITSEYDLLYKLKDFWKNNKDNKTLKYEISKVRRILTLWADTEKRFSLIKFHLRIFVAISTVTMFLSIGFLVIVEKLEGSFYSSSFLLAIILICSTIAVFSAAMLFLRFLGKQVIMLPEKPQ